MDLRAGGVLTAIAGLERWNVLDICRGICYGHAMQRTVKLFRNGRNQAVRIPREFELPGDTAVLTKEGDRLVLEPAPKRGLLAYLAQMKPIGESIGPIEDLPAEPVDF